MNLVGTGADSDLLPVDEAPGPANDVGTARIIVRTDGYVVGMGGNEGSSRGNDVYPAGKEVGAGANDFTDPIDVSLLGADAVVQPPDDSADLIEQLGWLRVGAGSVHAVFPYGGARAPLYNPLCLQGVASLTAAPAAIYR